MEMLERVIPLLAGRQADDTHWWLPFRDITTASELRSHLQELVIAPTHTCRHDA